MAAVAGRYARAFAEVVADRQMSSEKTVQELTQIATLIDSSHELRNVLSNPAVEHKQKIGLLDAIIKKMGEPGCCGTLWLCSSTTNASARLAILPSSSSAIWMSGWASPKRA